MMREALRCVDPEKLDMLEKVGIARIHGLFGVDPFPAFIVRTLGKG